MIKSHIFIFIILLGLCLKSQEAIGAKSIRPTRPCPVVFSGLEEGNSQPTIKAKNRPKVTKNPFIKLHRLNERNKNLKILLNILTHREFRVRMVGLNYLYFNFDAVKAEYPRDYKLLYNEVFNIANSDSHLSAKLRAFEVLHRENPNNKDLKILSEVDPIFIRILDSIHLP